jgi:hypothetical protein
LLEEEGEEVVPAVEEVQEVVDEAGDRLEI